MSGTRRRRRKGREKKIKTEEGDKGSTEKGVVVNLTSKSQNKFEMNAL